MLNVKLFETLLMYFTESRKIKYLFKYETKTVQFNHEQHMIPRNIIFIYFITIKSKLKIEILRTFILYLIFCSLFVFYANKPPVRNVTKSPIYSGVSSLVYHQQLFPNPLINIVGRKKRNMFRSKN